PTGPSSVTRRNTGTCESVACRRSSTALSRDALGTPRPGEEREARMGGLSGEVANGPVAQGGPLIPVVTPTIPVKPVACFTLPDPAPRGAVRRVGPRPDPTRSAHIDEPGGMAIRPGDRSEALSR